LMSGHMGPIHYVCLLNKSVLNDNDKP